MALITMCLFTLATQEHFPACTVDRLLYLPKSRMSNCPKLLLPLFSPNIPKASVGKDAHTHHKSFRSCVLFRPYRSGFHRSMIDSPALFFSLTFQKRPVRSPIRPPSSHLPHVVAHGLPKSSCSTPSSKVWRSALQSHHLFRSILVVSTEAF